jgi:hypothetical protein
MIFENRSSRVILLLRSSGFLGLFGLGGDVRDGENVKARAARSIGFFVALG